MGRIITGVPVKEAYYEHYETVFVDGRKKLVCPYCGVEAGIQKTDYCKCLNCYEYFDLPHDS